MRNGGKKIFEQTPPPPPTHTLLPQSSVKKRGGAYFWEPTLPVFAKPRHVQFVTSMMIYHRGASLSEQHTDLLICHCTKQDLSHTGRYVDKSSPEIARYRICMPTARAATFSVATYA